MSQSLRKRGPAKSQLHKQKKSACGEYKKSRKQFAVIAVIVILAAIPFALGKYFELNYPDPFDSGANVYSAKHILEGARIGVEEKPSAALGTLLVNILGVWLFGFNEIGPKLTQGILQAAALVFMFVAMRKLFGTLAAAVGVIIASLYLSSPLVAKFGNVKEQYMIAFMMMGMSCFVLRQLKGRWWWTFLAGAFVSWAPLFKETGISAIGAIGLFVIVQPLFKHRTWRQTGVDILLLLAGAAASIAPLYIWIIAGNVQMGLPYAFVWKAVGKILLPTEGAAQVSSYVSQSRRLVTFAQQWPRVLRFYWLLILPIALAAGAIIARLVRMILRSVRKLPGEGGKNYDRFVLLLAVWWILDMAFVWISPRSYEQYYLPLNASAAMLGGYLIALYSDKLSAATIKHKWVLVGAAALVVMVIMSWHILFGTEKSPHTGRNYGYKRWGYQQKLREISQRRKGGKGPWENVGQYIRTHSEPTDKIYVWGWYPGIYVSAQRFSSASRAFCMPRPAPQKLAETVVTLLAEFEREPPKFMVDSRKRHIPTERPPYELWPTLPKGFMGIQKPRLLPPNNKNLIAQYDKWWGDVLRKNFGEDEAARYDVLGPFREFVMKNYELTEPNLYVATKDGQVLHRLFGEHRVFQLKESASVKELHQ
jgi:4-amino-4-deoxy-L-arabinose transferase-like glycosyltransferase